MNVLITGCSRGIGKALLDLLKKDQEIKKIFAVSRSASFLEAGTLKIQGIDVDFLSPSWLTTIKEEVGSTPIHILYNLAGVLHKESFEHSSEKMIRNTFEVNFFAPFQLVQALSQNLEQGKAHVVNIGSMGGFQGSVKFPGLAVYSSSKAALASLTECIAEEWRSKGVSCNLLALGAVNTEMLQEAFPGYEAEVSAKQMADYLSDFGKNGHKLFNGKVLPVSVTTP